MKGPFSSDESTHSRGRQAERDGRVWLERQGYSVVEANYRTHVGEIDLVAHDGEVLCFIEIKARETTHFGFAVAAVTPHQQKRISRAASLYLQSSDHEGDCRFDVLAMDWDGDGWHFELIRDAFAAG